MSRSARESIINHFASSPRKNIDHVTKVRVVIDHVMSSQRKYRSHNEQPEKVGIDRLMSNIDHITRCCRNYKSYHEQSEKNLILQKTKNI
jgi:hypothetical protein